MGLEGVLVGFHVGDQYFSRYASDDPNPQVAAYKLESRFKAAAQTVGVQIDCISSAAVTTFPGNQRIIFPGSNQRDPAGGSIKVNGLINLPGLKLVSRLFGSLSSLLARRGPSPDFVCVYAAHSPNLIAALVYKKLRGVPYVVYVADLPLFMDLGIHRSALRRALKKLDASMINCLLRQAAGLIVVTKPMVTDNTALQSCRYLVLEGIAEVVDEPMVPASEDAKAKRIIFYAGGLNKAYGIKELVEGFKRADLHDVELWLCGRGDLEEYVKSEAGQNSAIRSMGYITPAEVAEIQARSSLLMLTRDPDLTYTRYSFPSKLLEYLASGVPTMTTRLYGIPDEYYAYVNAIDDASVEGVAKSLQVFFAEDYNVFKEKAQKGKAWVAREKTGGAVGTKIMDFIKDVV
jgi:glycosyltransferase involved in cell wall biosynthesis